MEHREIRQRLSSYLDGALSAAEKREVEEHLRGCPRCSGALAELGRTVRHLQSLPRQEPPPWLATRIMARVREEAGNKPRESLWRRLFFPLHVKLPLEAVGLLFICVTGYYLARTMAPDLLPPAPPAGRVEEPLPSVSPHPSAEVDKSGKAPPVSAPPLRHAEPAAVPAAPPALPSAPVPAKPAPPAAGFAPPPSPPLPAAEERVREQEAAPRMLKSESAPADAGRAKRLEAPEQLPAAPAPAFQPRPLQVRLSVDNPLTAGGEIEKSITSLGGTVVRRQIAAESRRITARIVGQQLPELLDRLGRLGRLAQRPQTDGPVAGDVEIDIRW